MSTLFGGLRWRDLSVGSKLTLVFGMQLTLIATLGLIFFLAFRSVERQRDTLRDAQRLEALTGNLQFEYVEAQHAHNDFVLGWDQLGYREAVQQHVPTYTREIEEIRETAGDIELLLEGSSLPSAAQALSDTRTLAAVADFYEARFLETVDALGRLADEENGAFAELESRGGALEQAGARVGDDGVVGAIFSMRRREELFRATRDAEELALLRGDAEDLDRQLSALATEEASEGVSATQEALQAYLAQVDAVETLADEFANKARSLDALVEEAEPIWVEVADLAIRDADQAVARAERISSLMNLVVGVGLGVTVVFGGLITLLTTQGITTRLARLTEAAQRLEDGELSARVDMLGGDEFGQLAGTFNAMAVQLQGMVSGLEARAMARARDLEIIGDISRAITSLRSPEELLREVVELVRDRFGFYHAQVFLIDSERQYAVLRESTGEAGRELLARGHRLAIGSRSVIGRVTAEGEAVVARDTDADPVHRRNELLPDTRSEMALPLRLGGEVIGALDVQSAEPDAFDEEDVAVFQTMADQLAIALRNAQLFEDAKSAVAEVERLNRQLIGQSWGQYLARRGPDAPRAYRIEGAEVLPEADGLPEELIEKLADEAVVRLSAEENGELQVAVPIRVRGEVIGAFGFGGEQLEGLSDEDIALIGAVAERVGIALENARLFEQTQRQARREQLVNQITSKIVGSTDVNDILQTTARELGKVLRAPETRIQLLGDLDDE